jgi:hypothetical protein
MNLSEKSRRLHNNKAIIRQWKGEESEMRKALLKTINHEVPHCVERIINDLMLY